jgi:hypothetical protein
MPVKPFETASTLDEYGDRALARFPTFPGDVQATEYGYRRAWRTSGPEVTKRPGLEGREI